MSGQSTITVARLAPLPHMPRPCGAFISYSHDSEGRRMEAALRPTLRSLGCDVVSDRDLPLRNTSSMPAWMDDQIANRVTICVLSPDYVHAFDEVADATVPRKGTRYELRAIRQRIYDHGQRDGCPVIPVASPQFDVEQAPATLRALDTSPFDPETGAGIDQLLARIVALEGTGGNGAMSTTEQVPPTNSRRMFREVVAKLKSDLSTERVTEHVRECLQLAEDPELTTELLLAFPLIAEVIKDHGQVGLMRDITDVCLRKLPSAEPRLPEERALEARVLICGKAWYLERDHRLHEALDEAKEGIQLAKWDEARRIAAYGKQSVGRIQRLLAEDAQGPDREVYLNASALSLDEARALFSAIDGPDARRSEVGACLGLSAWTQLTRYRLLNEGSALARADELAGQAAELLPPDQRRDSFDLMILEAEIAAANRRYADSRKLLGDVIVSLDSEHCAPCSEILARALAARARVTLASPRGSRGEVLHDLRQARDIFSSQDLGHAAAGCSWTILTVDPASATKLKIDRNDLRELEALAVDPRTRLAAIAELERRAGTMVTKHRPKKRTNWRSLVNQVKRYE